MNKALQRAIMATRGRDKRLSKLREFWKIWNKTHGKESKG